MATRTTPKGTWCTRRRAPRRPVPVLPNQLPFKMPGAVGIKCSRCSSLSVIGEQPKPSLRARLRARLRHPLRRSSQPAKARERAHEAYRDHLCPGHHRNYVKPDAESVEHEFHDPELGRMAKIARRFGFRMATSYFWVGGTGSWDTSTATHWSLTSGGAGGAGVPGSTDTVTVDGNSGSPTITTSGSITVQNHAITTTTATLVYGGAFTCTSTTTLTAGAINTNSQTVTWNTFNCTGASSRSLTLGSSVITILGASATVWNVTGSGYTITAGTSSITLTGLFASWVGGTANYNNVSMTQCATAAWAGTGAYASVSWSQATPTTTGGVSVFNNFTVGTLTIIGAAQPNRFLVASSTVGTARIITAATVSIGTGMDLQDITGAGAGSWNLVAALAGDCGGNSGITFAPGATQFWVGSGGNWSDPTHWASTSGGSGSSGRSPLPQDDMIMDGLSFSTRGTLNVDCLRLCRNFDCSAATNTPQINFSGTSPTVYGNVVNGLHMFNGSIFTHSALILAGRGLQTIKTNGGSWGGGLQIATPTGTYTLSDDLFTLNGTFAVANGSFVGGGHNTTVGAAVSNTAGNTRTINMGSGTWTVTGAVSIPFNFLGAGVTWNTSAATLVIADTSSTAKTFLGNGQTYHNIQIAHGLGSVTFTGGGTFDQILAPSDNVILQAGQTWNITSAAGLQINGSANGYEYLPGIAGNYCSTPDSAPLDISGDIDLRVRLAADDWSPAINSYLASKYGASGSNESYAIYIGAGTGPIGLSLSADGTTTNSITSVTATGIADGTLGWVRATWKQSTGVVQFFTAPGSLANPVLGDWTQLGPNKSIAIGSLFNSSAGLEIGSIFTGVTDSTAGKFYRVQVWNGIEGLGGVKAFDADFTTKSLGANTFVESSANAATVTINGTIARMGDGRASITSTVPGTPATISCASGVVHASAIVIQDITATGGATFRAAAENSILVSGDTGWVLYGNTFTASCSGTSTVAAVMAGTGQVMATVGGMSEVDAALSATASLHAEVDALSELDAILAGGVDVTCVELTVESVTTVDLVLEAC